MPIISGPEPGPIIPIDIPALMLYLRPGDPIEINDGPTDLPATLAALHRAMDDSTYDLAAAAQHDISDGDNVELLAVVAETADNEYDTGHDWTDDTDALIAEINDDLDILDGQGVNMKRIDVADISKWYPPQDGGPGKAPDDDHTDPPWEVV